MATIWGKSASFEALNDGDEPTTGHGFGGVILYASGTTDASSLYYRTGDGTQHKLMSDATLSGSSATINDIQASVVSASFGKFNNLTFKDVDAVHFSGSAATINSIQATVVSASVGKFNNLTFKDVDAVSVTAGVVSASIGQINALTVKDVNAVAVDAENLTATSTVSASIGQINALTVKDVNAVDVNAPTITATTTLSGAAVQGTTITGQTATLYDITSGGTISGSIINALTISGALGKFEGTVSASIGQINALTVKDVDAVHVAAGTVSGSTLQGNSATIKHITSNGNIVSTGVISGSSATIKHITSTGIVQGGDVKATNLISASVGQINALTVKDVNAVAVDAENLTATSTVSASIGQINALTVKDVNAVAVDAANLTATSTVSASIATLNKLTSSEVSASVGKFAQADATKLRVFNIASDELLVGGGTNHVTGAATLKFKDDNGAITDGLTVGALGKGRNFSVYGENRASDTTQNGAQYIQWNSLTSNFRVSGALVLETSMKSGSSQGGGVGTAIIWRNNQAQYGFNADDRAKITMCNRTNVSNSLGALVAQTLLISGSKGISIVGANNEDNYLLELPNDRDARARSWATYSSAKLKKSVKTIKNPIDTVKSMRGVKYQWKCDDHDDVGFIAEEMANVVPEVVKLNRHGQATSIDYGRLTSYLVEAIKEQQKQIEDLKDTVTKLKK